MSKQNVLPLIHDAGDRFAGLRPEELGEGEVQSLVSLALAVLATIYPAYRAARQAPAEALRNE